MLALTRDPDATVRYDAVMALGRFGYVDAIEPLVDLVRQGKVKIASGARQEWRWHGSDGGPSCW